MKDCYEIEIIIFLCKIIASVNFQMICSSTRPSSQTKGGLTCEIVAAEVGFLFYLLLELHRIFKNESVKSRALRAHVPYVLYVPACLTCPTCSTCPRALRALRARVLYVPYVLYVSACYTCYTCPRALRAVLSTI